MLSSPKGVVMPHKYQTPDPNAWMRIKIYEDIRAREQEMAKRRAELGLPEESGGVLGGIVVFLVFAAIVAALVVGGVVLVRYGYARHWWW